jgi:AcrR family transcriptional regulator
MADVIEAAFTLVKKYGWSGLSAAAVADKLGCSTMPIYSHCQNLEKLQDEVVKKGWALLQEYESKTYTGDVWIDQAIGYVGFAKEEKKLFMCMFDGRNLKLHRQMLKRHWENLSHLLEHYRAFRDLTREQSLRVRYSRAMLSHGVAMAVSMGYGEILENDAMITEYLTSASHSLLQGFQLVPLPGGKDKFSLHRKFEEIKNR